MKQILGMILLIPLLSTVALDEALGQSKPVTVEGALDCGQWVNARTTRQSIALEHFLVGFLDGLSVGKDAEFWRVNGVAVSREAVYLWMDNYCRQHPLDQFFVGAVSLFDERSGWNVVSQTPSKKQ